jgi:hypothetical protein
MVAGGAYAVHKHHQHQEQEQDQQRADEAAAAQDEEASPQQEPAAAGSDEVAQLTELKSLLDSGALTQEEFDAEKRKIIG